MLRRLLEHIGHHAVTGISWVNQWVINRWNRD